MPANDYYIFNHRLLDRRVVALRVIENKGSRACE